jgi:hypothetical protein
METRSLAALLSLFAVGSCERLTSRGCTERLAVRALPTATPRSLPSLELVVDLPDDAMVQEGPSGIVMVLHPGHRNPLRIDLKRAADVDVADWQDVKKRSLTPQLQLTYRERVQEGGSGGENAILDGELTSGGARYRVTYQQQSEYAQTASSCLPVLASLRPMTH